MDVRTNLSDLVVQIVEPTPSEESSYQMSKERISSELVSTTKIGVSFLMMLTVMKGIKQGKRASINVHVKLKLSLFMP